MTAIKMLPHTEPEHEFEAPWHAEVFALTVHLNEAGIFTWPEWAAQFGAALAEAGLEKELDGGQDYYLIWLDTLACILEQKGHADRKTLARLADEWEEAYRQTPHGKPVCLSSIG